MKIEIMPSERQDRDKARTAHFPQPSARPGGGTATDKETQKREEVNKNTAAGRRENTRGAGRDPRTGREEDKKNKEAVRETGERTSEDLTTKKKARRDGDRDPAEKKGNKPRKNRKEREDKGQAGSFDPTENKN
jgi:Prephenate dehydrogenase